MHELHLTKREYDYIGAMKEISPQQSQGNGNTCSFLVDACCTCSFTGFALPNSLSISILPTIDVKSSLVYSFSQKYFMQLLKFQVMITS